MYERRGAVVTELAGTGHWRRSGISLYHWVGACTLEILGNYLEKAAAQRPRKDPTPYADPSIVYAHMRFEISSGPPCDLGHGTRQSGK